MCRAVHHRSRMCGHHWYAIVVSCWPGGGFSTCPHFRDGVAREPAQDMPPTDLPCPECAMHGRYDRNLIRMVVHMEDRWKWGLGPNRGDPGIECVIL
ncbi:hypothetical protein F4778DRAFT_715611 [Xylariomycetidae sp. FL2044]|nr:hypothetical protein F4778DRAFT_715611 [Xylariomycetidae sp. FL2044]